MNYIGKNNLVEDVYNQLLQMIASGEWKEGEKLPSESMFCEILGVSRNTVRTALSRLNALGLLETRQGFGYCVRNLNEGIYLNMMLPSMVLHSRDLESVTEFRIGVESEAAALSAVRATPEDIEKMRIACENGAKSLDDEDSFAKYDMQFHHMVAVGSKNELFIKASEMLENMYTVWLMGFLRTHGMKRSKDFHYNIYLSIFNHEPNKAKQYMVDHLTDVLEKIKKDNRQTRKLRESKKDSPL